MNEYTSNGIMYTWDIVNSQGASFVLFPSDDNTEEQIKDAKAEIYSQHDVVRFRIATIEDRDDHYKTAYFRDKRVLKLRWFEIEQDPKLIRSERMKGTSPAEFVEKFVLPFIGRTKLKFIRQYGEKILID